VHCSVHDCAQPKGHPTRPLRLTRHLDPLGPQSTVARLGPHAPPRTLHAEVSLDHHSTCFLPRPLKLLPHAEAAKGSLKSNGSSPLPLHVPSPPDDAHLGHSMSSDECKSGSKPPLLGALGKKSANCPLKSSGSLEQELLPQQPRFTACQEAKRVSLHTVCCRSLLLRYEDLLFEQTAPACSPTHP